MNPNYIYTGRPSETFQLTVTDAAQQFAVALRRPVNSHAIGALITCEDNDVKFCLGGSDPVSDGLGHILYATQSIKLANPYAISTFSYINSVAQSVGILQVTFSFEVGV